MTKLLEQALLKPFAGSSPTSQNEIARAMLTLAGDQGEDWSQSTPRTCPMFWRASRKPNAVSFATDAEVEAAFRRFDR